MPDLTGIPSGVSAPLLIAFAILLLIERFIGVFDKYQHWVKNKTLSSEESPLEISGAVEPAAAGESTPVLSGKAIFGYSFIGAIFFPFVNLIALSIFIHSSVFIEGYAYNLLSSMVFAIISSSVIVFYISKKYEPIRKYVLVCMFSGLAVSAVIATPVNIATTSVSVNKHLD